MGKVAERQKELPKAQGQARARAQPGSPSPGASLQQQGLGQEPVWGIGRPGSGRGALGLASLLLEIPSPLGALHWHVSVEAFVLPQWAIQAGLWRTITSY
jgi:hypothetical protein